MTLNKREIAMLERAFEADIRAAMTGSLPLIQTRSKLAEKLADEGFLKRVEHKLGGRFPVTVRGYSLTLAGNLAYCTSLDDSEQSEDAADQNATQDQRTG